MRDSQPLIGDSTQRLRSLDMSIMPDLGHVTTIHLDLNDSELGWLPAVRTAPRRRNTDVSIMPGLGHVTTHPPRSHQVLTWLAACSATSTTTGKSGRVKHAFPGSCDKPSTLA